MSTNTKATADLFLQIKKEKTTEDVFTYKQALEFLGKAENYLYSGDPYDHDRAATFQDWIVSKIASAAAIAGYPFVGPGAPVIEDRIILSCTNWDKDTFVDTGIKVRDNAKKIASYLADPNKYNLARVKIETTAYEVIKPIGGGTVENFSIITDYRLVALRLANGTWLELV